ncbi:hypothetical protein GGI16_001581 [Coemansia sp. S142-1]|nr:hypothetical protein GGI16_001581 [Coemansia sp. S142-1]
MADDCIKNIHNNVHHNLPLTVLQVIELELTTDIWKEGKLFPQPESDQRMAKWKKQWPKSKHCKICAMAVADTTMPNVCATPVGDDTSAAGDARSDIDSNAWSDIGAYIDCDIWSDIDSDAWSDGDSYVDCDAYVDCNAWPTVSTYVDYDTWSDVDSNAHDEAGNEQVNSTTSVAVIDCRYTHKCNDDYDLTRMAHICHRRNRQENWEKLEKQLGIHHSQHVPPVKDLAVNIQSQHTLLILHTGCKARHKHPGRNVAPISVDPVIKERGLADEQACKKQDQDQEKAVTCSRQLALWRDYQHRLKDVRSDARSHAKAVYDRLCSMIKSKKFDWDAKNSSADWVWYGALAAEALKLPDDEHLKQIQDSYADAIVSDSSKPGRQCKSTRAAVEPADTESAMISTDPAQADVIATQPATIELTQSPMELVGDVSAMDVDGPLSAPVAHGSAMDVDGASAKTEYIGLSKEPPPTKKMSGYEKKGRMLSKALMFMYNQNVKLDSLGGKQVALIPLFAAEASHITIDSRGLYEIICSVAKAHEHFDRPETNRDDFYHNRLFYWPHYFRLPQEYLRRHGVDVVGDKKYFNLMLTTDGVGVSIGLTWWRSFRKGKAKQDDDNEQLPSDEDDIAPSPYDNDDNEDEDNYSSTDTVLVKGVRVGRVFDKPAPTDYGREFVGADPGAGKIASLSKLSDPTWHRFYSASTYYADIGNATRVAESESDIDSVKGLRDWMSKMPDSRTSTAEKALQRLKDLYGSRFCCELLNIRMSLATRKRRWYFFRRKRRAIVQACQYWTYGLDKKKTTICIGDAKFSTSRHGFRATPSIRMFGRYLQEAGWHVIYIWEFNTSRVCSNCHLDLAHDEFPNAMCGLGEEADNFAYRHKAKSTFKVRRCTNPACGRPWDRDRNAAWNIAYLGMLRYFQRERPLYFSKSLDNLPKYASDNRAARNAAAQEVGLRRWQQLKRR